MKTTQQQPRRRNRVSTAVSTPPPDYLVRQSELAAELGCNRSSISRYVQKGMPATADGLLHRRQALLWIRQFTSGARGGWSGDDSICTRAARLLSRER